MAAIFYELTCEVRHPAIGPLREVVTVTDPTAWAWRCFEVDFATMCATCTTRDGALYVTPSRAWVDASAMGEGGMVRLLSFRRIEPGSLAHNLVEVMRRAAAGEVGAPIKRSSPQALR